MASKERDSQKRAPGSTSKREKEAGRRERLEQIQRAQKAQERRRLILGGVVLAVILVVLVVAIVLGVGGHKSSTTATGKQIIPSAPTGSTYVQPKPARVANTSGIKGVLAFDTKGYPAPGTTDSGTLGHDHLDQPITYAVTPPVGGPHNPIWMNAGVYTKPVPSVRAVHDLEHGAVWITYRPNLPASTVQALQALVGRQSMIDESGGQANRYIVMSPWADNALPSPIVLSSWGYQLRVTSPTDPRIQKFIDTFRHNQKYTPEFGSPVDGIPVQTGGRPAMDGSKEPNPAGAVNGQGM